MVESRGTRCRLLAFYHVIVVRQILVAGKSKKLKYNKLEYIF